MGVVAVAGMKPAAALKPVGVPRLKAGAFSATDRKNLIEKICRYYYNDLVAMKE
jgi:hypothetical protein